MNSRNLTRVELAFYPEHTNHWLRFGSPVERIVLDKRRSLALFEPDQIFGYVRWSANEYGTQEWRLTVLQAQKPSLLLSRVSGVIPGAEVLLLMRGKTRVKQAFIHLDALEAKGFALTDVSPSYYRHIHVRLMAKREVHAYSSEQQAAHLAARRVQPCGI